MRSVPIREEQARSLLGTHSFKGTPIYRGVPNSTGPYAYVQPSQHNRLSANTKNYVSLFLANSPAWREYPKRTQSIICSNLAGDADSYAWGGTSYRVLPKQGSKIGVCSAYDFWDSFPLLGDLNLYSIQELNNRLVRIAELFLPNEQLHETNYAHLVNQFEYISKRMEGYPAYAKFLAHGSIIDTLEVILNPESNGFTLQTAGSLSVDEHREIWTDGDSLLIDVKRFDEFIEDPNASQ